MSHATLSTQRGSCGRGDPLLGTTGVAIMVIFQITSFPRERTGKIQSKGRRQLLKDGNIQNQDKNDFGWRD